MEQKMKKLKKYNSRPRFQRVDLAPTIFKSVDKNDILPYKSLESEFDKVNNVIYPPLNNTGLKMLRYSSVYHLNCLEAVAEDVTRSGWQPISTVPHPSEKEKKCWNWFLMIIGIMKHCLMWCWIIGPILMPRLK